MTSITTKVATAKSSLAPSMTLKGHRDWIRYVSYFSDGQRMISGSHDTTARQWDLKEGKEIEELRDVYEEQWVLAVAVSRDSRWVVTAGGDDDRAELNVFEVKTGTMKKLQGHSDQITCIDISDDNKLLASGSLDETARIWNLKTGKLVAYPFKSVDWVNAVRFSTDSKKLAVELWGGSCLEVWDIQSQKLDARIGDKSEFGLTQGVPLFWTNNNKNILAAFSFTPGVTKDDVPKTIYEFDASTLETVGTPFEGHTNYVTGLALSFDGILLASSSHGDNTIKLWAFESRQLLASFDVHIPGVLILSPDSRNLAYTTCTVISSSNSALPEMTDHRICICDTPPDVLAKAHTIARKKRALSDLLDSDATHRPTAGRRRPPIHAMPTQVHTKDTLPVLDRFTHLLGETAMASASTKVATTKSILAPSMTLKGYGDTIVSMSYFPDGQRMISGSWDNSARQWDLKEGKEIVEARNVYDEWSCPQAVAVSRDSRWVVIGGGDVQFVDTAELNVCEVETGIVKELQGHSKRIDCIDISEDNTLLASGSCDETARIWNLQTGKLMAGPFECLGDGVGAVRFSSDSKKLAVTGSWTGMYLEVWDIQSQKLVKRIWNRYSGTFFPSPPIFWTNKNKNILAAFNFTGDDGAKTTYMAKTIYEFDASTLETVGTHFEGHTLALLGLALSFDCALLASSSRDNTIKLWAFESRQLLASFNIQNLGVLVFSPDSRKLAYATYTKVSSTREHDHRICICDIPPDILARAQARTIVRKMPALALIDQLNPDGTRRLVAGCRKRPIHITPAVHPAPTINPQQSSFRLSKLLRFSPRTNALWPGRNDQPRDLLHVPAALPLPSSLSGQAATQFNHFEIGSPPPRSNRVAQSLRQHLSFFTPRPSLTPPVVEVAPGRKFLRLAAVKLPEYKKVDDTRHPTSQQGTVPQENDISDVDSLPDVHWCNAFLCYCSCWSHGRPRMPPRWRLERVDIPRQNGTTNGSRNGVNGRS